MVKEYRNKIIEGKCIDLVPVKEEFFSAIVELRNQKKSLYFFNQLLPLTIAQQRDWYKKYLERFDDLYWCIRNKDGIIVGTVRLYDILPESCSHGSFVIHEDYTMGLPYALEAEILTLEFAFKKLGVDYVINENRYDNKTMNSMTKKMGFKFDKEVEIRGVKYNKYILHENDCKAEKYKKILDKFWEEHVQKNCPS